MAAVDTNGVPKRLESPDANLFMNNPAQAISGGCVVLKSPILAAGRRKSRVLKSVSH
jgi:hypothetical protein